jgi:hypothetical protein
MQIQKQDSGTLLKLLTIINQLHLKAFEIKDRQALIFFILNDTIQAIRYDRAVLWEFHQGRWTLLGVSGLAAIDQASEVVETWQSLIQDLKDPAKVQRVGPDSFSQEVPLWESVANSDLKISALWLPIFAHNELVGGLWLERWADVKWQSNDIGFLNNLIKIYGVAWERLNYRPSLVKSFTSWRKFRIPLLLSLLLLPLFLIHLPLRIVAPCEIVAESPTIITAPLEGTIAQVVVNPGELVEEGQVLFEYDKRVPMEKLKVARKQVEITQSELDRATTLSFKDPKSATELAILSLKLQKEQINLDLAEYYASQLVVKAPHSGIIVMDDPDSWRGKAVTVGEKVLTVSDPYDTKIRIYIPENDNILPDPEKPIKVILNIDPRVTWQAYLEYISDYTQLSAKDIPSFVAEADWVEQPKETKIGLKGSAILYGDNVSLFYWLFRKPWAYLRNLIGF